MTTIPDGGPAASARSLLLTVLGEHVFPGEEMTWTGALLYVMRGLGVSEPGCRQAIARCAAAGWIQGERHGRHARWRLTERGRRLVAQSIERVFFSLQEDAAWDGRWLVVLVSVPRDRRTERRRLYRALGWAGFGNPSPGVWLTPHTGRAAEARRLIADVGLADTSLAFLGVAADVGIAQEEIIRRAWDLAGVAGRYRTLLDRYGDRTPAAGDEVLLTQIELTWSLGRLPFLDPQLPGELLPGWIGREALARLGSLRSSWFRDAHARWDEVVVDTTPA